MLIRFNRELPLETTKGKVTLFHDGHLYYQRKSDQVSTYWRCHKSGCCGAVRTLTGNDDVIFPQRKRKLNEDSEEQHSLYPDCVISEFQYMNLQARDQMIRFVKLGIEFGEAYNRVAASMVDPSITSPAYVEAKAYKELQPKESLRSCATKAKVKYFPKEPKTIYGIDIEVLKDFTKIKRNDDEFQRFLLPTDGAKRIFVFATDESLLSLSRSKIIQVDGTFKICPKVYHDVKGQVLTLHGYVNETLLPLAFALLPSKERDDYDFALGMIMNHFRANGINTAWEVAVTDLEKPLMRSVADILQVTVRGCYFHFAQALKRNITGELLNFYKEGRYRFKTFFQYLKALAKLPEHEVQNNFDVLWSTYKAINSTDPVDKVHFQAGGIIYKVCYLLKGITSINSYFSISL